MGRSHFVVGYNVMQHGLAKSSYIQTSTNISSSGGRTSSIGRVPSFSTADKPLHCPSGLSR